MARGGVRVSASDEYTFKCSKPCQVIVPSPDRIGTLQVSEGMDDREKKRTAGQAFLLHSIIILEKEKTSHFLSLKYYSTVQ